MRYYKIVTSSQTWDATGDPYALNVEMDISVGPNYAPQNNNSAWCRVWGIPKSTLLNANQFNNQTISVYGGMQKGLPLANPNEQGLLVQGTVYKCLGNWINTDMTLDFFIAIGALGNSSVHGAANITHNWPAGQPLSTAIQNALKTAFPGFTANVQISPNLVRPNDEWGFYQSLGQYATILMNASRDIIKTSGYPGVQVNVQGKTINVTDGTQQQTGPKTVNPQDLVGQPVWIDTNTIQIKTVMRGDFNIKDQITLPKTLATLTYGGSSTFGTAGPSNNLIQGTFTINSIRHVGNYRQPSWSDWCTIFDCTNYNASSTNATGLATATNGRVAGPV